MKFHLCEVLAQEQRWCLIFTASRYLYNFTDVFNSSTQLVIRICSKEQHVMVGKYCMAVNVWNQIKIDFASGY